MADFKMDDVFQQHHDLLEQVEKGENLQALVARAQSVIEQARRMGRTVKSHQSRQQLASIASFWAKYVFDNTASYPETLLYPLDPSAPALRPAALNFEAEGGAQAAPGAVPSIPVTNGTGILLVSITQPTSGSFVSVGTSFTVSGLYAGLKASHRLFVMSDSSQEVGFVLAPGFAPPQDQQQGMWTSEPITLQKLGSLVLGVGLAVSEAAIQTMTAAFEAGTPVEGTPDGALVFSRLCTVTIHE